MKVPSRTRRGSGCPALIHVSSPVPSTSDPNCAVTNVPGGNWPSMIRLTAR